MTHCLCVQVDCLANLIRKNIRAEVQANITATFRRFQRIIQSLAKIGRFLENFEDNLDKFEPLKECVDELIRRSICGRCTRNIPPFCTNVCGALVRVCLSPVLTGLRGQFNILWRYIRYLYTLAQMDLRNLFTQLQNNLVNLSGVVSSENFAHGIHVPDTSSVYIINKYYYEDLAMFMYNKQLWSRHSLHHNVMEQASV